MLYGRIRRKHTEFQKLKADSQKKRNKLHNDRSGKAEKNGHIDSEAFQSVILGIFGFANRRRRDIDGCTATLFDCLVRAGIVKDDSLDFIQGSSFTAVKGKRDFVQIIIIDKEND